MSVDGIDDDDDDTSNPGKTSVQLSVESGSLSGSGLWTADPILSQMLRS